MSDCVISDNMVLSFFFSSSFFFGRTLFMLGVSKSWKLVVSSHGQSEEQNLGLAVIYSCVSYTEGLVDVLFTV